jgi:hypothetical protein
MGLTVGGTEELMQRLNFLADNTTATGDRMIEIVMRVSGTFKTLNIPTEVAAGWAGFADQIEVTGRLAASGLNQMMQKMMTMPGMMAKMLKDPTGAVKDYLESFATMEPARRAQKVLKIFGNEAGRFVLKAVTNLELLDNAMKKAASDEALGSMDREFERILARSSTAGKRIKETWIDITREIGTGFLRMFDKYSDRLIENSEWMLNFIKAHPGLVKFVGILALIAVATVAIVIPLGFMMIAISALIPVVATLGVGLTAVGLGVNSIVWPVLLAVVAFQAWSSAIKSVIDNFEILKQPGFFKDLKGFLTLTDPEAPTKTPEQELSEEAAIQQQLYRMGQKKQKVEIGGRIDITSPEGTNVDSNIGLNTGHQLSGAGAGF